MSPFSSHVEELLVAYQLGASSDPERLAVEAHLGECATCLRGYFALKRQVDLAAEPEIRPSAQLRVRLRADVARGLVPRRRIPFRLLAAGAAVAAALTLLFWVERHNPTRSSLELPLSKTLIDTGSDALVARVQ